MSDLTSDTYNKQQERLRQERFSRVQFLEDMSLELCDDNFDVEVSSEIKPASICKRMHTPTHLIARSRIHLITVRMKKKGLSNNPLGAYGAKRFDYNDIKDTLLSMISYMESEGYTIDIIRVSNKYTHELIPAELNTNDEKLYLLGSDKQTELNYSIGQLVIKFEPSVDAAQEVPKGMYSYTWHVDEPEVH